MQAETGGGFGGKEEYPSMIAGHAALLAWKSGKPVKIVYDRAEDMAATTKRHPSRTRHRTGGHARRQTPRAWTSISRSTAAPTRRSRPSFSRAARFMPPGLTSVRTCASIPKWWPQICRRRAPSADSARRKAFSRWNAISIASRRPPVSAPEEFRRRNFIRPGETTATGQVIREPIDMNQACSIARFAKAATPRSAKTFARENPGRSLKKGIGLAAFFHGAGFTGSGEEYLASVVEAEATAEGHVRIMAASTEIGQGTNTIFSQIAADALGIPYDRIEIAQPDTAAVPNSGPTVASRTSMIVGKLVESAAIGIKQSLVAAESARAQLYTPEDFARACREYISAHGPLRARVQYHAAAGRQMGRQDLHRRRVRRVRVGRLRRRSHRGHGHV